MRKLFITIIILSISIFKASISKEVLNLKFIEMEVLRNGNVIGFSKYKFFKENNSLKVENETKFKVDMFCLLYTSPSPRDS